MNQLTRRNVLLASAAFPAALFGASVSPATESDQSINLPTRITREQIAKTDRKPNATFEGTNILVVSAHVLGGALFTYVGIYVQGAADADYHLKIYAALKNATPEPRVKVSPKTGILKLQAEGKTLLSCDLRAI